MAEGFANYYGKGWIEGYSAGIHPLGYLPPETIAVMKEKGVDVSRQQSKSIETVSLDLMDYVVTLEAALANRIPLPTRRIVGVSWHVPDPITRPLDDYRRARDQIEAKVLDLIDHLQNQ